MDTSTLPSLITRSDYNNSSSAKLEQVKPDNCESQNKDSKINTKDQDQQGTKNQNHGNRILHPKAIDKSIYPTADPSITYNIRAKLVDRYDEILFFDTEEGKKYLLLLRAHDMYLKPYGTIFCYYLIK